MSVSSPRRAGEIQRDTVQGGCGRSPRQNRGDGSDEGICWTKSGGEVAEAARAGVPPADVGLHSDVLMISHGALKDQISPSSQSTYLPAVIKIAEPEAFQVPKWHFLSTKDKNYLKHNLHMCSYRLAQELDHAPNS